MPISDVVGTSPNTKSTKSNNSAQDQAYKAAEFLASFGGDVDQAVTALRAAARAHKQRHSKTVIPADAPVVIDVAHVSKFYKPGKQKITALNNANLQIRQGEFVAITGPSGGGKSTLLQLIGGLDKPSEGNVTVAGHDLGKLSDKKLSDFRGQTIGFVFQFFYLQPFLKLQANIEVPAMFARTDKTSRAQRATELATSVGLSERLQHLPKELSGGQMQRAAIARALLNNPKVLLADEPTGNLDSSNSQAIIELFEQIRRDFGTTVVIVTHDAAIAARADREIHMKDGGVVDL